MVSRPRTVLPAANAPSSFMPNQAPNSFASAIARHTRERGARSTTRFSIRSVFIVVLEPMHDAVLFLSAERREVEQVVGVEERVETALVGRVGVEHAGPVTEEHAQAFPLAFMRPALGLLADGRVVVGRVGGVERHATHTTYN